MGNVECKCNFSHFKINNTLIRRLAREIHVIQFRDACVN